MCSVHNLNVGCVWEWWRQKSAVTNAWIGILLSHSVIALCHSRFLSILGLGRSTLLVVTVNCCGELGHTQFSYQLKKTFM